MSKLLIFFILIQKVLPGISQETDSLFLKYSDFSGVVLVAENNQPVYFKANGYRDFENKIQMQPSDIFELASITKQFTAMIIMILKEKGYLQYDDPLEKYLQIPYKGITIRHLLTHTSGLPDYQDIMDKYWDKSKVAGNTECIEYLNKYAPPVLFEPGAKYTYSNTGYLLLASIAEKASGKDYTRLCRKWIFRKLKMKSTDIRSLEKKSSTANFAIGHIYVNEKNKYVRADSFPSSDYTIWLGNREGPGRISSTAEDLLKWDKALYTERPVKNPSLQEAFTPMKLNDGNLSYYGFGWTIREDSLMGKIVSHTGDNPGYKTIIIRYIDQKKTIIALNNNASENFGKVIEELKKKL